MQPLWKMEFIMHIKPIFKWRKEIRINEVGYNKNAMVDKVQK